MNIIERIAEIKIRLDRGNSILYWFRNIVIIVAGLSLIFKTMKLSTIIILGITLIAILYLIGWLDLNKVKLYQAEAKLSTGKYNPYFKQLKRDVKKV